LLCYQTNCVSCASRLAHLARSAPRSPIEIDQTLPGASVSEAEVCYGILPKNCIDNFPVGSRPEYVRVKSSKYACMSGWFSNGCRAAFVWYRVRFRQPFPTAIPEICRYLRISERREAHGWVKLDTNATRFLHPVLNHFE